MARVHLRIHDRGAQTLAASNAFPEQDARARAEAAFAADYLWNIQAIREALPGGWRCETPLGGRDILDRALQRSRGAVLWCSPFVGSDLAPKKALAEYRLTHLSAPSHPFSPTRFGTLLLNPVRLRAVNRYLVRRVLVVYGNSRPALDVLKQVLSENGVVLITAVGAGKRSLTFPFLGGTIELAVGAPRLAYETGSALIPVSTLPDQKGGYRVELGPDLAAPTDLPEQQAVLQMTSRYVELLEPVVRAYPAQWEGWFHPGTWRQAAI
jgi:lauroyl/myristoyl acyltransferase